jgi:hypothetical protein
MVLLAVILQLHVGQHAHFGIFQCRHGRRVLAAADRIQPDQVAAHVETDHLVAGPFGGKRRLQASGLDRIDRMQFITGAIENLAGLDMAMGARELAGSVNGRAGRGILLAETIECTTRGALRDGK